MKAHSRLLAIAAALLAACAPTPTPTPGPQALLDQAAQAVLALTSAEFALTREGAPAVLDPQTNTTFSEATGQYQAPDRVKAAAKVTLFGSVAEVQLLWVPEGFFVSNPLTGLLAPSEAAIAFNGPALFGAGGLAAVLRDGLANAVLTGTETVDEVEVYHLTGDTDGAALEAVTAGALAAGQSYPVDIWIDAATFNVVRVHVTESETDGWLLELFNFNAPADIQAP